MPESAAEPAPEPPDWSEAVALTAERAEDGVVVTVHIADGFHVYGRKERLALPLSVEVDADVGRARVPKGNKHRSDTGVASWWLEGDVSIPVRTDARSGRVNYQVCNEGSCSPPTAQSWMVP